ncbi:MAG: NAD(P)/FAD-dependent oxidoreductase [Verrucomicrobiota bacterium]|nr:NAD(P)/FAD-dependent oxidoreductase [Verrucomicrobiota bacterium]
MSELTIIVVGGGAAGFFGAIAASETAPGAQVTLLEKGGQFLSKVRISGGGRCNVTHACFDVRDFSARYPRGSKELISPFHQFDARSTISWFKARGVELKTEADGRMFPVTDSSQTIIDCLVGTAQKNGVQMRTNSTVERIEKNQKGFRVLLFDGKALQADKLLLATGGCRSEALGSLATSLGHTLQPPVPSLFTFHIELPWLRALSGVSLPEVEIAIPGTSLRERGPLLITHWGLSGPAVLKLSAWGARELNRLNYQFTIELNWLPHLSVEAVRNELLKRIQTNGAKMVVNSPISPLTARFWEALVLSSGIAPETRWAGLSRAAQHHLSQTISRTQFHVTGKSLNKDEFVTCGGVRLDEVNLKTMESKISPGLYFAGELLDIDGITGGFNFQAAWTTGWIAGRSMALTSS